MPKNQKKINDPWRLVHLKQCIRMQISKEKDLEPNDSKSNGKKPYHIQQQTKEKKEKKVYFPL